MHPINCVFHTGTEPILLKEDLVKHYWLPLIGLCDIPVLEQATNQKLKVTGTIFLHVLIGESLLRIMFGMVRNFGDSRPSWHAVYRYF